MSDDEHGTDAGPSLEESIAALTPGQAQRALLLFFDSLPREGWQSGKKPSPVSIETQANELEADAPAEIRPMFEALRAGGDDLVKAEVARKVLVRLAEQAPLRLYVEEALVEARKARLSPLPGNIWAYLIMLAALSTKIEIVMEDGKKTILITCRAPEVIHQLTAFLKALPGSIWSLKP